MLRLQRPYRVPINYLKHSRLISSQVTENGTTNKVTSSLGSDLSKEAPKEIQLPPLSSLPATFWEVKHGDPAAIIQLRSHHVPLLNLFTHFVVHAAAALGIPLSRPTPLPIQRTLWTVPRSPFVHKKSQENFERKVHRRVMKAWDANPELIDVWQRYLMKHELGGVGMRFVKWQRAPLGVGRLPSPPEEDLDDGTVHVPDEMRAMGLTQAFLKIRKFSSRPPDFVDRDNRLTHAQAMYLKHHTKGLRGLLARKPDYVQYLTHGEREKLRIMDVKEAKRLERLAEQEEAERVKRAQRPDFVKAGSIKELEKMVKHERRLTDVHSVLRPTYSVVPDLEEEAIRNLEREEAERRLAVEAASETLALEPQKKARMFADSLAPALSNTDEDVNSSDAGLHATDELQDPSLSQSSRKEAEVVTLEKVANNIQEERDTSSKRRTVANRRKPSP